MSSAREANKPKYDVEKLAAEFLAANGGTIPANFKGGLFPEGFLEALGKLAGVSFTDAKPKPKAKAGSKRKAPASAGAGCSSSASRIPPAKMSKDLTEEERLAMHLPSYLLPGANTYVKKYLSTKAALLTDAKQVAMEKAYEASLTPDQKTLTAEMEAEEAKRGMAFMYTDTVHPRTKKEKEAAEEDTFVPTLAAMRARPIVWISKDAGAALDFVRYMYFDLGCGGIDDASGGISFTSTADSYGRIEFGLTRPPVWSELAAGGFVQAALADALASTNELLEDESWHQVSSDAIPCVCSWYLAVRNCYPS